MAIGQVLFALAAAAAKRAPRQMSLTSMSTLATLARTGPRRITDLAAVEGVTQPSMTALVSGLERAGLVERRSDPADKRVALVVLTALGADGITARYRAGADAFARMIEKLPAEAAAALAAALPALEQLCDLDDE